MKNLILTSIMSLAGLCAMGQANKPVITVEQFTGSNSTQVETLRNKVISAIQQSGRVNVIDINNQTALNNEQERRRDERAMDDAGRVDDMSQLMSNGLLKGSLDNITVTKKTGKSYDGKTTTSYTAVLKYTLTLVDAANGTVIAQKNLESSCSGDTDGLAIQCALDVKISPVKRFIENAYAVGGKIIAADEKDAKKVKTVYIDLGSNDGLNKGQKMEVFKEIDIAGEKSKKLIGEIQIQEVMGASRSLCKVTKGGDVILTELEAGASLPIETKEQKSNFFKGMFEE